MTKLSPAAQAVLDAINKELDEAPWDLTFIAGSTAAAALRAVADQVAPSEECPKRPLNCDTQERLQFQDRFSRWHQASLMEQQIHAIANELEAL